MFELMKKYPALLKEALPAFENVDDGINRYNTFLNDMITKHMDHYLETFEGEHDLRAYINSNYNLVISTADGSKHVTYPLSSYVSEVASC